MKKEDHREEQRKPLLILELLIVLLLRPVLLQLDEKHPSLELLAGKGYGAEVAQQNPNLEVMTYGR